jgi:hypothetical protein
MHVALKWVTFLIALGFTWIVAQSFEPYKALHTAPTLDGKPIFKPSEVRKRLDALNDEHFLANYREQESSVDLIFPLAYGLALVLAVLYLSPGVRAPRWLVVLPLITVVSDYSENATAMALCKLYPGDLGKLPVIASIASGTKWITLLGSTLLVAGLAIAWPFRRSGARAPTA